MAQNIKVDKNKLFSNGARVIFFIKLEIFLILFDEKAIIETLIDKTIKRN